MNFEVWKGNIVDIESEAIVLPANEGLKEGSGTSTAIFRAAGRKELTEACNSIGTCAVGSAVPTPAFNLDSRFIIHAVVPKWMDGNHNEYELLSSAYMTSLKLADILECESIAFPLLASGNNGFDKKLAAEIAAESVRSFTGTNVKRVLLVVYGDHTSRLMEEFGYEVNPIPAKPQGRDQKAPNIDAQEIVKVIKQVDEFVQKNNNRFTPGCNIQAELLNMALNWVAEPKNRERALNFGKDIVNKVKGH